MKGPSLKARRKEVVIPGIGSLEKQASEGKGLVVSPFSGLTGCEDPRMKMTTPCVGSGNGDWWSC